VLSQREQQIWDEIERGYQTDTDEVGRVVEEVPVAVMTGVAVVVFGFWATVILALLGAFVVAAVVGLATGLLWRFWPLLRERDRESLRGDGQAVASAARGLGRATDGVCRRTTSTVHTTSAQPSPMPAAKETVGSSRSQP